MNPRGPAALATLIVLLALAACVPVATLGQERPVIETDTTLDHRSARCSTLSRECAEPTAAARSWSFALPQPAAILVQLSGAPRQLLWVEVTGPGSEVLFRGRADGAPAVITASRAGVHRILLSALTRDQEFAVAVVVRVR